MTKRIKYQKDLTQNDTFIKPLKLMNSSQEFYIQMLRESTITFGIGPAGTGKTYLATYIALEALLSNQVNKIVLTRPLVATEDIGYLPGDMSEKIAPYLMPLFDAIEYHIGINRSKQLFLDNRIEILPLAYMRGRSLDKCFMILDEAQNSTKDQMKMFLTRIGYNSKIVITGDTGQSDLQNCQENGLEWATNRLIGVSGEIGITEFTSKHIVRNSLIEKILKYLDGPRK